MFLNINNLTADELAYVFEQGLEKIASEQEASAEDFMDGLEKIASFTGIDPEFLGEEILAFQEAMIKEAQIDAYVDALSEEEAEQLLEEAAENPDLAPLIGEIEEAEENESLAKLVALVDALSDEEAAELAASIDA